MAVIAETGTRIQQLPQSVINKIAAGEVIERPASVVKELLENSVDALATRIDVEVEQGGAELIRVVDNGEGIHPDDLLLAVASHATSKLRSAEDLFSVQTMGFRGEALASIAEVSRFRLRSRQADQLTGFELDVEGGAIQQPQPCGCPVGTQIEVRQLFFNTPVRRKFLKSPATEMAYLSEQFTRIAIANPQLQMTLRHNSRVVYELPAAQHQLERLELFFGAELARNLIPIEGEYAGIRLWGYVGHPSQHKATRKGQYLYLNGRWIQDRSLQHALGEAYRGLLMVGRQPIAFLFVEIPPTLVDVNVHPTKSEVRFQDSQTLYRLVLSSLRNRFLSMNLDAPLQKPRWSAGEGTTAESVSEPAEEDADRRQQIQRELIDWTTEALRSAREAVPASPSAVGLSQSAEDQSAFLQLDSEFRTTAAHHQQATQGTPAAEYLAAETLLASADRSEQAPPAASRPSAGLFRAMQIHDCYLIVETEQGITIIDQHALHERIMYENLRRRILNGKVEVQRLLIPLTVELSPRESGLLLDHQELLQELGLPLEAFSGSTLLLTGTPVLLKKSDPVRLLRDIADLLENSGSRLTRRELLDSLLHMMACKAAIKAGQRLAPEEIDALLEQRHLCEDHHHCPHGRPTALNLTRDELDRQFGRLG